MLRGSSCPIRQKLRVIRENTTVATRQVMELADGRCNVRDRYVCSFPRRHDSAGLVRPRTSQTVSYSAAHRTASAERRFVAYVGCSACALHCVTVTYCPWLAAWVPTGSGTVECLPGQRVPSQEVIHRSRRLRACLRECSQRAGLLEVGDSSGEAFTATVFTHTHLYSSIGVPTGSAFCRHGSTLAAGARARRRRTRCLVE